MADHSGIHNPTTPNRSFREPLLRTKGQFCQNERCTHTVLMGKVTGMFPADVDIQKIVAVVQKCFDFDEPPLWRITRVQDACWMCCRNSLPHSLICAIASENVVFFGVEILDFSWVGFCSS